MNHSQPANGEDQVQLARNSEVLWQSIEDEVVLLDLQSETYFGLDAVGSRIWDLVGGDVGCTFEHLCQQLTEEFDVAPDILRHEVTEFLAELQSAGLLHISGGQLT